MRLLTIFLVVAAFFSAAPLWAVEGQPLSAADQAEIRAAVTEMQRTLETGDPDPIIQRTHASLIKQMGGADKFATRLRSAVKEMYGKVKFANLAFGTVSQVYPAGSEEVCFQPFTTTMTINDRKMAIEGYFIAIRTPGQPWKYMDSAGLRRQPDLLWKLLPDFPRDVSLPPNSLTPLP